MITFILKENIIFPMFHEHKNTKLSHFHLFQKGVNFWVLHSYSTGDDTTFSYGMQCQTALRYFLSLYSKLVLGYEKLRITHLIKLDPTCINDWSFCLMAEI